MSTTFSAADIVGKTLTAQVRCSVYRDASDTAVSFGTVAAGQPVGVVDSWLDPKASVPRSGLWWMFRDQSGLYYYVPHKTGLFNVSELKKQGVITVDEKIRQEQEKADAENLPWYELMIKKYGIWVLGTLVALKAVPALIDKSFNKSK